MCESGLVFLYECEREREGHKRLYQDLRSSMLLSHFTEYLSPGQCTWGGGGGEGCTLLRGHQFLNKANKTLVF